jgi:hypothetical protein
VVPSSRQAVVRRRPKSVTDFWSAPGTTDVFYRADGLLDGNPPHVV